MPSRPKKKRSIPSRLKKAFEAFRNKGLTLPGYNFLGPFNSLDNGEPTSKSDAAAKEHDKEYEKLGTKAYYSFNSADDRLLQTLENEKDWGAVLAKGYFSGKKRLANAGILPSLQDPPISPIKKKVKRTHHIVRRRRTFDEFASNLSGNIDSLSNFRPSKQLKLNSSKQAKLRSIMSSEKGSGNAQGLKETPLDSIQHVERGIPSYTYASLPYTRISKYQSLFKTHDITYRMTSPYDTIVGLVTTDTNAGTGTDTTMTAVADASDVIATKAMWFDYYASIYKYYSVVGCKWSMVFENLSHEPVWVHQLYFTGDTPPPAQATNQDILQWSGVNSHFVPAATMSADDGGLIQRQFPAQSEGGAVGESDTTESTSNWPSGTTQPLLNSNRSEKLQLSGSYRPGDSTRDIHQDSEVETWSLTNTSPVLRECLLLRVKPETAGVKANSTQTADRPIRFRYHFKAEYLVEFKELKDGLKYPVNNQPATVTIVNDVTSDQT